ncbi:MAG TPA: sulfurtransferase TusA [Marinobacterium sp.]|nr:sulfurtransferase TusA [Marinobacterium sp.]
MNTLKADTQLDARGLYCPEPVMMLHNKIADIAVGALVEVLATDPSTVRDIPKFCNFLGHELLSHEQMGDEYHYLIRKGS